MNGAWGGRTVFNAVGRHIFRTFKHYAKVIAIAYDRNIQHGLRFVPVYYSINADNCGNSSERTRQSTVGAILVDSQAFVAM